MSWKNQLNTIQQSLFLEKLLPLPKDTQIVVCSSIDIWFNKKTRCSSFRLNSEYGFSNLSIGGLLKKLSADNSSKTIANLAYSVHPKEIASTMLIPNARYTAFEAIITYLKPIVDITFGKNSARVKKELILNEYILVNKLLKTGKVNILYCTQDVADYIQNSRPHENKSK